MGKKQAINRAIVIRGARQNNLKNLDLEIPLNRFTVITGVSGSGKSSLAFDTLYAEGQRRYVETFSAYARQFLDRMDRPNVDSIEGILPAIAIDQVNPVRTSRSTVGTMTELNDHLKLLFARSSTLYCQKCGKAVRRDSSQSISRALLEKYTDDVRAVVTFALSVPATMTEAELTGWLSTQGYTRVFSRENGVVYVVQDRVRLVARSRSRLVEALDSALGYGRGHVAIQILDANETWLNVERFSSEFHCAACDLKYADPVPSLFSFNSPLGACETCRGFGRVIGIDYRLVVPDATKSLAGGAIKPWQTPSYRECQSDLLKFSRKRGIPVDIPWCELSDAHQRWVIEGEGSWDDGAWYGVKRFFDWLESKSYKMHIRVLLSRYRTYRTCTVCGGARLKPQALLWRVGVNAGESKDRIGRNIYEIMSMPLSACLELFSALTLPAPHDEAVALVLKEICARLAYLVDVGLGYLTLDRQSRTLSGGEVQRINLTTALGTSLVNTLFVLDEPSIGLHARDVDRLVGILNRVRDAGNTLVVVEHDPQVIVAADQVIEMGPGAGKAGGNIVFQGTVAALGKNTDAATASYLTGRRHLSRERKLAIKSRHPRLSIRGARQHNLKNIDIDIPLNRFVVLTGVSGSGKSTLVQDVIYNALRQTWGRPLEEPGEHDCILGLDQLDDVVLVDQSPIGKTTRSTPAVYVGAFDSIRALFAAQPLSKQRNYKASTFSFNSGAGRCPTCGGNGFERVEMQFLSDVYLRCADCNGTRFRTEVREVRLYSARTGEAKSIADVLAMTVDDALEYFFDAADIQAALAPLQAVGLGYLALGQSVPTLSGGEAQRLKLASFLSEKGRVEGRRVLFMFDEPTTGLHYSDIEKLLKAFDALLDAGHSVLVIEHHVELISTADWIIDLGPEGGDQGGEVVCVGTPQDVARHGKSYTGSALRSLGKNANRLKTKKTLPVVTSASRSIEILRAREHNLKNVDITIERDKFTVITGLSGSGKSTVAFDILFAEGQRRYLESLNAYARQFVQPAARADVDAVYGIAPTVAIEQRSSRGGRKSTVATVTEIYHYLRLLYVKLGVQHCPKCRVAIAPQSLESITAAIIKNYARDKIQLFAPLVVGRKGIYKELAQWAVSKGFDELWVDGCAVDAKAWPKLDRYKEHDIDLPIAVLSVSNNQEDQLRQEVQRALDLGKGMVRLRRLAGRKQRGNSIVLYSTERACPTCERSFPELDPRMFSYNSKHGWCPRCFGTGAEIRGFDAEQSGEESAWAEADESDTRVCRECNGQRLNPSALSVEFSGYSIAEVACLSVDHAKILVSKLKLNGRSAEIANDILAELKARLGFLQNVGLGYLSLDRAAPTLSGGEAQRIRLASQLGSNLRGVCYVLDEPTIGLHARDNKLLLDTLHRLQKRGNTIVVVEHDEETIRSADRIIDLGPGAGVEGGYVVAQGTVKQVMASKASLTGRFLAKSMHHDAVHRRPFDAKNPQSEFIQIAGASRHNLRVSNGVIPLNRLVCVTGVSGSGKSTLIRDVLQTNLSVLLSKRSRRAKLQGCAEISGWESLRRVLEVDQTPIGKTPRSCPVTYLGVWDDIRTIFSQTEEARVRGYKAARFSFNVGGGRCAECEGQGEKTIEMSFLPNVKVRCEACDGARFNRDTLEVRYRGKNIADILALNFEQATAFFEAHERLRHAFSLLCDVGLAYLTLGQQSPTLSGGEAQRLKLVTELAKVRPGVENKNATLYVLDEPSVGLHMADVAKLLVVLQRLVDAGNSVVIIEHNLDLIAEADWVIDMGPEGGERGGKIVACGTPEFVASKKSHTAVALRAILR